MTSSSVHQNIGSPKQEDSMEGFTILMAFVYFSIAIFMIVVAVKFVNAVEKMSNAIEKIAEIFERK